MAETSLGRKRPRLNELGHHVLWENHTGLLGSHTRMKELVLDLESTRHRILKQLTSLVLLGLVHRIHFITALLLIGGTTTELRRRLKRGRTIHLTTTHLIAGKSNRVTEPLTSQKDRHLDPKASLRVKERSHMVVLQELGNELRIGRGEFCALLGKADTSRIHHGKIITKRLQKLDRTGLKDRHIFFSWLPSK